MRIGVLSLQTQWSNLSDGCKGVWKQSLESCHCERSEAICQMDAKVFENNHWSLVIANAVKQSFRMMQKCLKTIIGVLSLRTQWSNFSDGCKGVWKQSLKFCHYERSEAICQNDAKVFKNNHWSFVIANAVKQSVRWMQRCLKTIIGVLSLRTQWSNLLEWCKSVWKQSLDFFPK